MDVNGLIAKLEKAIEEIVTLRVTTIVNGKTLQTVINLALGDISMNVDPFFLDPAQKAIVDMHVAREKQGADILKANVAAVERLVKLLPQLKKLG